MPLSKFPRVTLSHLPTPIEHLCRISEKLGGPQIFIKRDDCTGLATGGNKARKLEFLIGDALAQGCDTILTVGGLQSNHARQTAAAAAKMGLKCELFLEDIPGTPEEGYADNGNILLDQLLGAKIHTYASDSSLMDLMAGRAAEIGKSGGKAYEVPLGGSSAIGALGYANCAFEIIEQEKEIGLSFDQLVMSTGSCGTQAGLLAGFTLAGHDLPISGINVSATEEDQKAKLRPILDDCCDLLGVPAIGDEKLTCNGDYFAPSYGVPNKGTIEAVSMLAREEAVILDPVYTGKGFAGLIGLIREGFFKKEEKVLFLHTGGQAALYPYGPVFKE